MGGAPSCTGASSTRSCSWDVDPARLVHHAVEAGDPARTVELSLRAARAAAGSRAHAEAAAHYARVLDHPELLDADARAEVLEAFAVESYAAGRADPALAACHEAVAAATGGGRCEPARRRPARALAAALVGERRRRRGGAGGRRGGRAPRAARRRAPAWRSRTPTAPSCSCWRSATRRRWRSASARSRWPASWATTPRWCTRRRPSGLRWRRRAGLEAGDALLADAIRLGIAIGADEQVCRAAVNVAWTAVDWQRLDRAEADCATALALADARENRAFRLYSLATRARAPRRARPVGRRRRRRRGSAGAGRGPGRRADTGAHLPRARRGPSRTGARRGRCSRRQPTWPGRPASSSACGPSPARSPSWPGCAATARRSTRLTRDAVRARARGRARLGRRRARELAPARRRPGRRTRLRRAAPAPDRGRAAGRRRVLARDRRPLPGRALPRRERRPGRAPRSAGDRRGARRRGARAAAAPAHAGARRERPARAAAVHPRQPGRAHGPAARDPRARRDGRDERRDRRAMLFLTPKTVEHHVGAVLAKLQVTTRAAAVARAHELGLAETAGSAAPT